MSITKGQNDNGDTIISGSGDYETEAKRDYQKLLQTPSEIGLGVNATGSSMQGQQSAGSAAGSITESQKTEKEKQDFWKHLKVIASILAFVITVIIVGFFLWYVDHSNKVAADNSKILTEIENLKNDIEQLRTDKNRDVDNLQRQLERFQTNNNPAPQP